MPASDEILQDYQRRCAADGPDHIDTLQVRSNLVAMLIREGRYDEAVEHATALVDARERIQGPSRLDTLKARRNHAVALWHSGRTREAWREAVLLEPQAEHCLGPAHQLTELVHADVIRWSEAVGLDPRPARPALPPVKFDAGTDVPGITKDVASYLSEVRRSGATVRVIDSDEEDAQSPELRREIYRRAGLDAEVVDLELRAAAAADAGDPVEALRLMDEAIPRLRRVYVREGRIILKARLFRVRCLVALDRTDEAVATLRVLLRTCERVLGRLSPVTVETRTLLAQQELLAGDSGAAAEHFEQLIEQGAVAPPGEASPRAELEARVAAAVHTGQGGNLQRAAEELADAIVDAHAIVEADDPFLLRLRYSHAATVGYSGRWPEGVELLRAVVEDMDTALGPFDPDTRDAREVLARLLYRMGERREACATMEDVMLLARRMEGPSAPQVLRAFDQLRYWSGASQQPFGFTS